jgi:acyl carrier protein
VREPRQSKHLRAILNKSNVMEEKFLNIISEALEISGDELTLETNFKDLDEWDSLSQLTLIAELDENFGVTIPTSSFKQINTLQELFDYVKENQ